MIITKHVKYWDIYITSCKRLHSKNISMILFWAKRLPIIHMPIVQIMKNHSVMEHVRYWLAIVPVSQPLQTHCWCQGSPKFLTSASLTGHNSLFPAHSTIHIPYCLGSLRRSILFPKRNLKFKKQISKNKTLWRKMFESEVYIIRRDESFKIN